MRALFHSSLSVFAMLAAFCAVSAACGQDAADANPVSSISSGETSGDSLENWSEYVPVKDSLIGSIRIHGSETLQGIVEVLAADFQRLYPEVSFEMRPEGSLLAIAGFAEGEDIIGTYSGLVGEQEKKALHELGINDILHIPVATDHIAVVVHPTNPLTSMSLGDLKSLFSAESEASSKTLWKKLTDEDGPQLFGPGFLSGTRAFFQARVLGEGKEFSSVYTAADRNAEILREIAASPKAIGFLTASSIDDSVRVLGLSETESTPAILPDFQEAESAKYPLERTLHLLVRTTGEHRLSRLDQEFIKYALSRQGALAIQRARFMPIDAELAAKTLSKVLEIETR